MPRFAQPHLHLLTITVPHKFHRYLVTRFVCEQGIDKRMGFIQRYATNAGDDVTCLWSSLAGRAVGRYTG